MLRVLGRVLEFSLHHLFEGWESQHVVMGGRLRFGNRLDPGNDEFYWVYTTLTV
jgi:hypothetical protein